MSPVSIKEEVRRALAEDIGTGDVTTTLIPATTKITATIICRETAILCGTSWFNEVFHQLDADIAIDWAKADGDLVPANQIICTLYGLARPLLSGERTALNFLQTLSGTATIAHRYASAVKGLPVRILDTRKTLPGLRQAQKYAVRCGGGHNHRHGLYDGILIKENHILAAGSITAAIARARIANSNLPVEIEVENLNELQQALAAGADILLLDNFDTPSLREAVRISQQRAKLEASGGITLKNIRQVAETGVDYISVGALTKDIRAVDLSIRFTPEAF
ncbi:nicotinate-nucleotide pyrophosphorylase (carboxylating) [Nitrosococcus oceani ATCC 19707]|uniref:Probable nicotinate-nucleotide pyrophosphorylase [carboxylating] n=2 Tax=Nitrosococcus oceani TaxID=1229 RepID=Q3JCR8_NITOC|nr:carboxylating nicotinate-nucleotide diphosphorylase [Nitrosococcus oceani]ABA57378.1 nicotinate-nucleotide pyrophosphorylase (carboxylating) [Nitrosococcus oceani ATCC 19707]EDZ68244.1 nicotinate-nucleotide pyrophosphorylase [Nitrosococcus oceani AFC27]KFI20201.1 nicotinate-nucleotide pyrophosphorylase [Nitrosococcus oceani C-27]GEM21737.1 nicotinate-nucleotide diphosphorylase (carboxylating) [Nitrosococcus oceani]